VTDSPVHDPELIGYIFAPLTGEDRAAADHRLRAIWTAAVGRLGLTEGNDPPATGQDPPQGRIAARFRAPGTLPQMFWDHTGDVAMISMALRPAAAERPANGPWIDLYDTWRALLAAGRPDHGAGGLLGTATVFTAVTSGGTSADVMAALPAAVSAPAGGPLATRDGIVVVALRSGEPYAGRPLLIHAPPGHDAQMGALAWAGPDAPLARYLRHAAKLDYHRAVADRDRISLHDQRRDVRDRLHALEPLITTDSVLDADSLDRAHRQLRMLQAGTSGLVDSLIQARTMRRTVAIAEANLRTAANLLQATPVDPSSGTADFISADAATARDLHADLDDHIEYLDAGRQRADYFAEILKQELAVRTEKLGAQAQRREERFVLYQTAVLGVIVIVLAAVQSLEYKVPLPGRVQPAVIALLGAIALLLSVMAARYTGRRPLISRLVRIAAACIGACVGWVIAALVLDPPAADRPVITVAAAACGAVLGYVIGRWTLSGAAAGRTAVS
jgi:hypothetical protein